MKSALSGGYTFTLGKPARRGASEKQKKENQREADSYKMSSQIQCYESETKLARS